MVRPPPRPAVPADDEDLRDRQREFVLRLEVDETRRVVRPRVGLHEAAVARAARRH